MIFFCPKYAYKRRKIKDEFLKTKLIFNDKEFFLMIIKAQILAEKFLTNIFNYDDLSRRNHYLNES